MDMVTANIKMHAMVGVWIHKQFFACKWIISLISQLYATLKEIELLMRKCFFIMCETVRN